MTEKKRQSTAQPEQTKGFAFPAEDELDLIDVLKFLARKKIFILAVTSVFTLMSIFYAQSITPVYRATVGFLVPKKDPLSSFSSAFELLPNEIAQRIAKDPYTIFDRFLVNIESYELKKEVFVNGGFQKKIFRETRVDTDQLVSAIYNSTKIVKRGGASYLELEGYQPKVMLEFLTALVEAAKENVNTEINDISHSLVNTIINNLSRQIEELQEKKAKEIARLKTLDIPKHVGMSKKAMLEFLKTLVVESAGENGDTIWFIDTRVNNLSTQIEKAKLKLKRFQTTAADLPLLKFKVVTVGEYSYALTKPYQSWVIVGFGVAFGLFVSIVMGFLIDLKQLGAKEIPSAST